MKIHGTTKGGAISKKDFGVAFSSAGGNGGGCENFEDSLGTDANGTVSGATISTSEKKFGAGAVSFDGSNDSVSITGIAADNAFSTNVGTISCWIMVDSPSVTDKTVFAWGDTNADTFLRVKVNQTDDENLLQFFCKIGGVTQWEGRSSTAVMGDGEWVNLIITQSGTTVEAYVNNEAVTWNAPTPPAVSSAWVNSDMDNFFLGAQKYNNVALTSFFEGYVDDFVIFDTVITSDQREFLQTNPASSLTDCDGIKAYYNCNEFDNSTLTNNAVPIE